jgi:hypothetical protein
MKASIWVVSMCAFVACGAVISHQSSIISTSKGLPQVSSTPITGDYVEARTASVFAGACHYNGEYMCTGRDAIMAWSFNGGAWNGTPLGGVKVMAVVTAADNLADSSFAHKSELVIDNSASAAQVSAAVAALEAQCPTSLGTVVAVRRAAISFADQDRQYTVSAPGFGSIATQPMPDNACCTQPSLVWYEPLMHLTGRKVGFTQDAAYTAGTLADPWEREGENGAFYGEFTF